MKARNLLPIKAHKIWHIISRSPSTSWVPFTGHLQDKKPCPVSVVSHFSSLPLLTHLQGGGTHSPISNQSSFAELCLSFCSVKTCPPEHFLETSLPKESEKCLGPDVCRLWAIWAGGTGFPPFQARPSYFSAAAPRGGCWIFCLIKLSSKSLWSQCVARPWQPAGLLNVHRGRRWLGQPDKPSSSRMKHSQKWHLRHPPTPATPLCHLPRI